MTGRPSWTRAVFCVAALAFVPLGLSAQSRPPGDARLTGRVVDAGNGDGVEGAAVKLLGTTFTAITDDDGHFRIDAIPSGRRVVHVERLGYQVRADTLVVPLGVELNVTLSISVDPIPLEEITVSLRSLLLEARGFYDRQAQGYSGYYADRATIEERDPLLVTDLFRSVPGVEVINNSRLIMSQSVNFYDGGRGCEPTLWLDGARTGLKQYDHLRAEHIEGVELYTGGSAPGKYNDLCGTVVIWTRVPMRRR